jgi:hypothetical protein
MAQTREEEMDTPIEAYMKLGIVHHMAFPELASGDGPWTIRRIALDPFFNAIEITHIEDPEVREEVRKLISLAHMGLGYGAHPAILGQGLDINALEEDMRSHVPSLKNISMRPSRWGLRVSVSFRARTQGRRGARRPWRR